MLYFDDNDAWLKQVSLTRERSDWDGTVRLETNNLLKSVPITKEQFEQIKQQALHEGLVYILLLLFFHRQILLKWCLRLALLLSHFLLEKHNLKQLQLLQPHLHQQQFR